MEMLLSVLRPVMSYVSDEALEDALAIAAQSAAGRSARPAKAPDPQPVPAMTGACATATTDDGEQAGGLRPGTIQYSVTRFVSQSS